ncbi:MAG: hypothetical protein OEL87_02820, partial [Nanoarchaeota archaeon]|nr:hypothetical protein [Nanoarchaeota archaeon]
GKIGTIRKMDKVFGLRLLDMEKIEIPKDVKLIAEEREKARGGKNWAKSDELRDKLGEMGWTIKDTKEGWDLERNDGSN